MVVLRVSDTYELHAAARWLFYEFDFLWIFLRFSSNENKMTCVPLLICHYAPRGRDIRKLIDELSEYSSSYSIIFFMFPRIWTERLSDVLFAYSFDLAVWFVPKMIAGRSGAHPKDPATDVEREQSTTTTDVESRLLGPIVRFVCPTPTRPWSSDLPSTTRCR